MRLDALGLGNVVTHDVKPIDVAPTLSEATQQYLQLKGIGKAKTFHQAALRNAGTVMEICGDRVVTEYRTTDAGQVRDALITERAKRPISQTFIHYYQSYHQSCDSRTWLRHAQPLLLHLHAGG